MFCSFYLNVKQKQGMPIRHVDHIVLSYIRPTKHLKIFWEPFVEFEPLSD
jgi:hypothetical protein